MEEETDLLLGEAEQQTASIDEIDRLDSAISELVGCVDDTEAKRDERDRVYDTTLRTVKEDLGIPVEDPEPSSTQEESPRDNKIFPLQ